jgi:hypothetical protein
LPGTTVPDSPRADDGITHKPQGQLILKLAFCLVVFELIQLRDLSLFDSWCCPLGKSWHLEIAPIYSENKKLAAQITRAANFPR